MKKQFICATQEPCDFSHRIPAPYLRRSFDLRFPPERATIRICGLGFYRLWINGQEITKGFFAPYISNPDDRMYYDVYDLTSLLRQGENVVGVLLGNGFQNDFGGAAWDFDRAAWRSAPKLALEFRADGSGQVLEFCADEQFRTHPSPIRFDEYRLGEIYDAAAELPGWNLPGADASGWEQHSYTALCSAADCAAIRMLKTYPNLKTVYLCLDHDSAGIEGAYRVAESIHALGDYTVWRKMPKNKDWDEDLKALHGRTAIPSTEHTKLECYRKICSEFLTDACMETDAWKHIAEAKG